MTALIKGSVTIHGMPHVSMESRQSLGWCTSASQKKPFVDWRRHGIPRYEVRHGTFIHMCRNSFSFVPFPLSPSPIILLPPADFLSFSCQSPSFFVCLFSPKRVSCNPGWPWTYRVSRITLNVWFSSLYLPSTGVTGVCSQACFLLIISYITFHHSFPSLCLPSPSSPSTPSLFPFRRGQASQRHQLNMAYQVWNKIRHLPRYWGWTRQPLRRTRVPRAGKGVRDSSWSLC